MPDLVQTVAYDPSGWGHLRNAYRKWTTRHDFWYATWRGFRYVATHPKTWPGIAGTFALLWLGVPFWLAWIPIAVRPIWKADKSQLRVFGSVKQSRSLTQGWHLDVLRHWWRVKKGWATGARAAGFVQSGRGGAVPRLHHWEVTNAGISAWVANGQFGWTGDDLVEVAPKLGTGIDECRMVRVSPGQFLGDAQIYFNFADPLRTEIPITRLPVPPRGKLCAGFDDQGEPVYVWKHLPILLAGLQGSGKTTQIGGLIASQLQSGEPVELWVADPNEGVDLEEFGNGSPIVREYAINRVEIRRMVLHLYEAMHERMRMMRGREKLHTPTLAAPRWYLIIDEMLKWHNALKGTDSIPQGKGKKAITHDYEAMFQEIMASQRRCAITTIANTQIPFDHAIGKGIGQLFPQKLVLRIVAKWVTSTLFGDGAGDVAPASKISIKYPGIGYVLNEEETELVRFRGPFMAKPILRMIANGILPDGVATTEEQQAERDNRPQVIYRWDHPTEGLLYIGISVSSFDRAKQHRENPDKEIFNDPGVLNKVMAKLTPDGIVHWYGDDGQVTPEPFDTPLGNGHTVLLEAQAHEKTLIQSLHPKLNIAHNGARVRDRKAITV